MDCGLVLISFKFYSLAKSIEWQVTVKHHLKHPKTSSAQQKRPTSLTSTCYPIQGYKWLFSPFLMESRLFESVEGLGYVEQASLLNRQHFVAYIGTKQ